MEDYIKKMEARGIIEKNYEWRKWCVEIPFISFKEDWEVKVIPPFGGAVARFIVRHKKDIKTNISIYLDCYSELGCMDEPYWELYPYNNDIGRFNMNNTEELIKAIDEELRKQISKNIEEKVAGNPSKFFTYSQNNSHGYFESNENVCRCVIIEAKSPEHANNIAENIGIYFDGCDKGEDCSCCGDRWERADEEDGYNEPIIYHVPIKDSDSECIVYYLNGTKKMINL